jgi:hypothetical protein
MLVLSRASIVAKTARNCNFFRNAESRCLALSEIFSAHRLMHAAEQIAQNAVVEIFAGLRRGG